MRTKHRHGTSHTAEAAVPGNGKRWQRRALSVLLLLHLTAVALAPFAFAASGPDIRSPLAYGLMGWFRPYIQFAFLDHGYFFFAPNPGPSHLLRCTVRVADDGDREVERFFPDRKLDYPRLLYHRHFMLSEQLNSMFTPPTAPPVPENAPEYERWKNDRRAYEVRRDAFLAHLKWRYKTDDVELTRVEHRIVAPAEWGRGMNLNARSLFLDLPENPDPELIYPEFVP